MPTKTPQGINATRSDDRLSPKSPAATTDAETERMLLQTLDFTRNDPLATKPVASAGVAAPATPVVSAVAAAAEARARAERAARLKQEAEVHQKLVVALQPGVEEALRARLVPELEQELRPKLIAALRPGIEAEVRTALIKELTPRVELELKTRFAKSLAAQKAADQQAAKAEPAAMSPPMKFEPAVMAPPAPVAAPAEEDGIGRVLASMSMPVFSVDKAGVCGYMSPAWTQFSGYTASEPVGKDLVSFFAQPNRRAINAMLTGIANGTVLRFEQQGALLRKDGEPLWVEISAAPLYASNGEVVGACGALRDAVESKRVAEQAEADGVRLLLLVDQIDTGVALEDRAGNIQQVNPAFCTLLSLEAAAYSLEGMPMAELLEFAAKGFASPERFLQRATEMRGAGDDVKGESFEMADGRVIEQDFLAVTVGESIVGRLWLYREASRKQNGLQP